MSGIPGGSSVDAITCVEKLFLRKKRSGGVVGFVMIF
jgi:hypothetical protein